MTAAAGLAAVTVGFAVDDSSTRWRAAGCGKPKPTRSVALIAVRSDVKYADRSTARVTS